MKISTWAQSALLTAFLFPLVAGPAVSQPAANAAITAPLAPVSSAQSVSPSAINVAVSVAPPSILCDGFSVTTKISNTNGVYTVELIYASAQKVRPFSSPANVRYLVTSDEYYKWTRTSENSSDDDYGVVRTRTVIQHSANRRTGEYLSSGEITLNYTDPKGVAQIARGMGQAKGVCEPLDKPKF